MNQVYVLTLKYNPAMMTDRLWYVDESKKYFITAEDEEGMTEQLHDELHAELLDAYKIETRPATREEIVAGGPPLRSLNPYYQPEGVDLWNDNLIQFSRFIAECEAEGVFTDDKLMEVGIQMDLTPGQVCEIINRAQNTWEQIKETLCPPNA